MIAVKFEEKEKIGLQYALETLHGCSPFGQERIRRLRFYAPEEGEIRINGIPHWRRSYTTWSRRPTPPVS